MSAIFSVQVAVPMVPQGYAVRVGVGVADELAASLRRAAPRGRTVGLLSDRHVMDHHGAGVIAQLEGAGLAIAPFVVEPGERSKSAEVLLGCLDAWAQAGLSRTDAVVGLGGGVVTDLAGLAAHLFHRGLPVVQCPTSLLAQVDASVGGKVAIDRPAAKNLVGAFHFPRAVLVDPAWLATLPADELAAGAAEMVKHALLFSADHLAHIERDVAAIAAAQAEALAPLIATSIALKAACVAADPFERAPAGRVLLNLGHTLGHAIEHASDFTVGHGQAVALGLVAAARLSVRRQLAAASLEPRVVGLLQRLGLPTALDPWLVGDRGARVRAALGHDKKRGGDTLTYIALTDVGAAVPVQLDPAQILALLGP